MHIPLDASLKICKMAVMEHFFRLVDHLPEPRTEHARACMERIRAILSKPVGEPPVQEREPGEDREEEI